MVYLRLGKTITFLWYKIRLVTFSAKPLNFRLVGKTMITFVRQISSLVAVSAKPLK